MLDSKVQITMMLKLKFIWNLFTLEVTNSSLETVIFDPKEMLGILDLRLIGYYKIKQGGLQQNLSKYSRFESADILHEQFNKFTSTLKWIKRKNPWLEPEDERKNMIDKEILDEYVDLDKSCLTDSEKTQVIDMLYKI